MRAQTTNTNIYPATTDFSVIMLFFFLKTKYKIQIEFLHHSSNFLNILLRLSSSRKTDIENPFHFIQYSYSVRHNYFREATVIPAN